MPNGHDPMQEHAPLPLSIEKKVRESDPNWATSHVPADRRIAHCCCAGAAFGTSVARSDCRQVAIRAFVRADGAERRPELWLAARSP